jgi:hypothetical protein
VRAGEHYLSQIPPSSKGQCKHRQEKQRLTQPS